MLGYNPIKKKIRCLNISDFVEITVLNELVFRIGKSEGYNEDIAQKITRWIELNIIQIIVNCKDVPAVVPFLNQMTLIFRAYRIPNGTTSVTFTDLYYGQIGDTVFTARLDYVETGLDTGKYAIYLKIKQAE